jgi:ribosomal protein S18 acetylase RimI-like enzyme
VQFAGEYRFGRFGRLAIPPSHAIVKNLLILPAYRGRKLGQKLNAARLAMIPAGTTPVGFIIPENRYAIRNWEELGFQRVLQVRQTRRVSGRARITVSWLNRGEGVEALYRALVESNRG